MEYDEAVTLRSMCEEWGLIATENTHSWAVHTAEYIITGAGRLSFSGREESGQEASLNPPWKAFLLHDIVKKTKSS